MAKVNHLTTLLYEDNIDFVKLLKLKKYGRAKEFVFEKDQVLDVKVTYKDIDWTLEITLIITKEGSFPNGSTLSEGWKGTGCESLFG